MVWKGERLWLRQVCRLVEVEHCSLPCVCSHLEAKALKRRLCSSPDGLPCAFWRMFPEQSATVLQDDFDRMMACELPAPTQVGVWIPKAKQGPTADYFPPLGMPDTLDRLRDGTTAAMLFRTTRSSFHPAQTMLNIFREPQSFFSTSTDAVWAWCPGHH